MIITNDYLLEAMNELKRLEHIIYVSLKYTRTTDVITNALKRLLEIFDLVIEAFLEKAKEENLIASLPKSPALRATRLGEIHSEDKILNDYLHFYQFLKNVLKSPYGKRQEFRRHVTLIVEFENSTAEANIDNLSNCERYVQGFFNYASKIIEGPQEDEENSEEN
jgi:hypothetical protein